MSIRNISQCIFLFSKLSVLNFYVTDAYEYYLTHVLLFINSFLRTIFDDITAMDCLVENIMVKMHNG